MTKKEIKSVSNEALIVEYVKTYSSFDANYVLRRGIDRLWSHMKDLEAELLKRNILSEDAIAELNK